ncbi:MAG TPA: hypothetical protein PLJ42_07115 [Chitinophagales bacterium]|jgi:hypothetical protein|nr:hypothetical protein [Chitinophagales bacterium]HQV78828.1 hypothetical protein [Chitinophagales bacterium]HQW79194.1 hypothetical protein [Chitinophagales bacterium]
MRAKIISTVIFLITNTLNAQTLKIQVSDSIIAKPEYLWLKVYSNGIFTLKDSVLVSNQNKNNISFNIGNYTNHINIIVQFV